jgi:hypothetical protein
MAEAIAAFPVGGYQLGHSPAGFGVGNFQPRRQIRAFGVHWNDQERTWTVLCHGNSEHGANCLVIHR